MKPFILILLVFSLTGCVMGATPHIVAETPASISYECIASFGGCQSSPQDVANSAQEHCRRYGKNARQIDLGVAPSGNLRASFACV